MRVVMRIVLAEFSLAWVMVLAGWGRAALKAAPFFAGTVAATWQRADWPRVHWRLLLGLLVGVPVVAGWPLLFSLMHTQRGYHLWMRGIAIPWWIILAACAVRYLAGWVEQSRRDA
jgi:hypothetical protein